LNVISRSNPIGVPCDAIHSSQSVSMIFSLMDELVREPKQQLAMRTSVSSQEGPQNAYGVLVFAGDEILTRLKIRPC